MVELAAEPIGRQLVTHTDGEALASDFGLLAAHRGRGSAPRCYESCWRRPGSAEAPSLCACGARSRRGETFLIHAGDAGVLPAQLIDVLARKARSDNLEQFSVPFQGPILPTSPERVDSNRITRPAELNSECWIGLRGLEERSGTVPRGSRVGGEALMTR